MGMFGPSTDELIAQERARGDNTAVNLRAAQLSPSQQVNFLGAQSGNQVGSGLRSIAQSAGFLKTPDMKNADKTQAIVARVQKENPELTGKEFYSKLAEEFDKAGLSDQSVKLRDTIAKLNEAEGKAQNQQALIQKNNAQAEKFKSEVIKNRKAGMPKELALEQALTEFENGDENQQAMAKRVREKIAKNEEYKAQQYQTQIERLQKARDAAEKRKDARAAREIQKEIDNMKLRSKGTNITMTNERGQAGDRQNPQVLKLSKKQEFGYKNYLARTTEYDKAMPDPQVNRNILSSLATAVDEGAIVGGVLGDPRVRGVVQGIAQYVKHPAVADLANRMASGNVMIDAEVITKMLDRMKDLGGNDSFQELEMIARSLPGSGGNPKAFQRFFNQLDAHMIKNEQRRNRYEAIKSHIDEATDSNDRSEASAGFRMANAFNLNNLESSKWDKLIPGITKVQSLDKIKASRPQMELEQGTSLQRSALDGIPKNAITFMRKQYPNATDAQLKAAWAKRQGK